MELTPEEKRFLDWLLDKAYEFRDGIEDWSMDTDMSMLPPEWRREDLANPEIEAVRALRQKIGLTGESAWKSVE